MKVFLENILGFDRIHKNKIYIFYFFKGEINLKFLWFFFLFF
jgi:hypothetical protein